MRLTNNVAFYGYMYYLDNWANCELLDGAVLGRPDFFYIQLMIQSRIRNVPRQIEADIILLVFGMTYQITQQIL